MIILLGYQVRPLISLLQKYNVWHILPGSLSTILRAMKRLNSSSSLLNSKQLYHFLASPSTLMRYYSYNVNERLFLQHHALPL